MFWRALNLGYERNPEGTAVDFPDRAWTYQDAVDDVDRESSAYDLNGAAVAVILGDKTHACYLAMLSASKVGASVVMVSPATPRRRLAQILRTVRPGAVLGPPAWLQSLPLENWADGTASRPRMLNRGCLLFPTSSWAGGAATAGEAVREDPGYIVFTSGSTGVPKGVPIMGSAIRAYLRTMGDLLQTTPESRLSHTFDLTFDAAMHDLLVAWSAGAALSIPRPGQHLAVSDYVVERRLTHWFSVPSVIDISSRLGKLRGGTLASLQVSAFGGEALTATQCRQWKAAGGSRLLHLYGPSEVTIASTFHWVTECEVRANDPIPIGRPLAGVTAHLRELKDGSGRSELCLGGAQCFTGYWDPAEDVDRFLSLGTSHGPTAGSSFYKTGDLVSQIETGELVYHGRLDNQVQVNGYRVETDEIERTAREVPGVSQVRVLSSLDRTTDLAILVLAFVGNVAESELTTYLRERLPNYMLPKVYRRFDDLPQLPSGKIDAAAVLSML